MSADNPITEEEAARIARLAEIELDADERRAIVRELGAILKYVAQLQELDVEGVPPTAHGEIERLRLREDANEESLPNEVALREAPKTSDGGFAVPAFVDEG